MCPGISIGSFCIRFYGILIMLGAIAAAFLAQYEARRRKLNTDLVWDGLIWVLIGGIIGARLWHVFTPPPSMLVLDPVTNQLANPYFVHNASIITNIIDMLAIWRGGLGIPGAVIGGAVALYIFCRRKKMSFLLWADIAAPGVALAQAIGRWGNYFNQELYGKPSNLPWAVKIDHPIAGYKMYSTFHPLFLYESIWNLLNMAFLLWMERRYADKLREGDIFLAYLIGYSTGRFLLEFLRLDAPVIGTINFNQAFMLVVALVAGFLLFWRHRKGNTPDTPGTQTHTTDA
jgi:phosphatidylglycerol:prolipoprotein diacylglycerol transferase